MMTKLYKNIILKRIFVLAGLGFVAMVATAMASPQQAARIYLRPVVQTETTLIADVIVDNVISLYGVDFEILFDPTILRVRDAVSRQQGLQIEPGPMFPATDSFVVTNQVDTQTGTISFAAVLVHPAPPLEQGGVLARLTFDRIQPAPLALQFEHAQLVSSDLQPVPLQAITLLLDSRLPQDKNITTVMATSGPKTSGGDAFPWWLVATLIVVLGLLTLGAYLVLGAGQQTSGPAPPLPVESAPLKSAMFDNSHHSPVR